MRVAVIGGGVAGSTVALILARASVNITLFEQRDSLISGPPFCHLHAGGNLYPDISDEQCLKLLKQSIDFAKLYPFVIDYRPTLIVMPTSNTQKVSDLLPRLKLLKEEYKRLVELDQTNRVLLDPKEYYKLYTREDIEKLKTKEIVKNPKTPDEWMIPPAKNIDLDKVQFPLILVNEYGLNLFRLSAGLTLELNRLKNIEIKSNTKITSIQKSSKRWSLKSKDRKFGEFDYLINATGFQTGEIDDMIGINSKRMVEFKAAYISRCDTKGAKWPEVIFHGKRGTPDGMGQFTPYPSGYFQLHGMTEDITLFRDGLAKSNFRSAYPKLKDYFIKKLDHGWQKEIIDERTTRAIKHLSKFIQNFDIAKTASKPLYGAQQIPGDDPTLRVAEVSFPAPNYARCEIVKVSSVLDMSKAILDDLGIDSSEIFYPLNDLDKDLLSSLAKEIAKNRDYPQEMANLLNSSI